MRSLIQIKNIPGNAAGTEPQLHRQQVARLGGVVAWRLITAKK